MQNHSILIIDDHALFRSGLRLVIQGSHGSHDIWGEMSVHEAGSLEAALQLPIESPAVILLDVQLHGINGIDGMVLLTRKWREAPIIILSGDASDATRREAMQRGAAAFVSKSDTSEMILATMRKVTGKRHLAPGKEQEDPGRPALTPRQIEVLDLVSQGLTNKAISRRLDLSENTVRSHVQAVLQALCVDNRSEAAFAARQRGLIR